MNSKFCFSAAANHVNSSVWYRIRKAFWLLHSSAAILVTSSLAFLLPCAMSILASEAVNAQENHPNQTNVQKGEIGDSDTILQYAFVERDLGEWVELETHFHLIVRGVAGGGHGCVGILLGKDSADGTEIIWKPMLVIDHGRGSDWLSGIATKSDHKKIKIRKAEYKSYPYHKPVVWVKNNDGIPWGDVRKQFALDNIKKQIIDFANSGAGDAIDLIFPIGGASRMLSF